MWHRRLGLADVSFASGMWNSRVISCEFLDCDLSVPDEITGDRRKRLPSISGPRQAEGKTVVVIAE